MPDVRNFTMPVLNLRFLHLCHKSLFFPTITKNERSNNLTNFMQRNTHQLSYINPLHIRWQQINFEFMPPHIISFHFYSNNKKMSPPGDRRLCTKLPSRNVARYVACWLPAVQHSLFETDMAIHHSSLRSSPRTVISLPISIVNTE